MPLPYTHFYVRNETSLGALSHAIRLLWRWGQIYNSPVERNVAQYRTWLELVGEFLQQRPGLALRYEEQLLQLFTESFYGACTTRNQVKNSWGNRIITCWPLRYIPDDPPGEYDYREQPLLRWHAFTGLRGPQSIGRVPEALASVRMKQAWHELAAPWNIDHQLSVPLQLGGSDLHSFLVQRPDEFTDQEMDLASLLQPILTGLAFHLRLVWSTTEASPRGLAAELTLQETAVLSLLSRGLSAVSSARRLGISSRTVEKHLEHIYRKLDVGDRLLAVQRGRELGLLGPS